MIPLVLGIIFILGMLSVNLDIHSYAVWFAWAKALVKCLVNYFSLHKEFMVFPVEQFTALISNGVDTSGQLLSTKRSPACTAERSTTF